MTEALLNYVSLLRDSKDHSGTLLQLYTNFISTFDTKLNQLQLARILVAIAGDIKDKKEGQKFLDEGVKKQQAKESDDKIKVTRDIPQARVYLQCESALLALQTGDVATAKDVIESSGEFLDSTIGVESIVYSAHYKLQLNYFKVVGPAEDYYKNSLLYLAYTPLETIPLEDQQMLAFDLCLAALVGESIYSFGDLLTQKILESIESGEAKWVVDLLRAFNAGDIPKYEDIVEKNAAALNAQPLLVQSKQVLTQKVAILSLIDLVFRKSLTDRNIDFEEIATATRLRLDEVEVCSSSYLISIYLRIYLFT